MTTASRADLKPQRRFQVLSPSARCRAAGCTFDEPGGRLDELVEAALDHIQDTGHEVAVTERSQVVYGPPKGAEKQ